MEKEKEGFPITSLREINMLLKAGKHPNIVKVRVRLRLCILIDPMLTDVLFLGDCGGQQHGQDLSCYGLRGTRFEKLIGNHEATIFDW